MQLPPSRESMMHSRTEKSDSKNVPSTRHSHEQSHMDAVSVIPPSDHAYDKLQALKLKQKELLDMKQKLENITEE